MTKYWLVGASWGGVDHQDQLFVEQGMWMLGCEDGAQPQRASKIQPRDRIAIKRMKGKGQTGIRFLHLGIVKGVILDTNKVICIVNWVATSTETFPRVGAASSQSIGLLNMMLGFKKPSACERSTNKMFQSTFDAILG